MDKPNGQTMDGRGTDHDRSANEFRRQLISTLAGALIGMTTSAGIAVFQWATETREHRLQERVSTVGEMSAILQRVPTAQALLWHNANRSTWLAVRAREIAAVTPIASEANSGRYLKWFDDVWQFEQGAANQTEAIGKLTADFASAHSRLTNLFTAVPPLTEGSFDTNVETWPISSTSLDANSLYKAAQYFDQQAQIYVAFATNLGKTATAWLANLNKLRQGIS
jgi:hypothetical protein